MKKASSGHYFNWNVQMLKSCSSMQGFSQRKGKLKLKFYFDSICLSIMNFFYHANRGAKNTAFQFCSE